MDKEELIDKIKQLPSLTNEEKSELIGGLRKKKYGLVWENHPEDVEEKLRTQLPVLVEDKSKQIASASEDAPNHILIEGDNLEALTALTYTHEGKVDVIYIDPPYNTGNKDFVYNDSFVDSEDGYRHSKWLSFMEKRLRIAKKLLSERGVIFISIDDNEQANLKLLCDEVFGGNNFLSQIIWERAFAPINLKKHFSVSHDYIIAYSKNIELSISNGLPRSLEANNRYSNPDNDPRGVWTSDNSTVGPEVKEKVYPVITPGGKTIFPPSGRCWLYTKERFEEMVRDNRIWFGQGGNNVPRVKRFLSEVKQGVTPMSIWRYNEVGHSQDASQKLKQLFGGKSLFDYPKPVELIKRCILLYSRPSSLILDFFAGSGTTLHATMQLNKEDGGHRQCILVTNNENNICEEVTYERNKRVINGYTTPKGEKVEGLMGNNLRYYKIDFVEREDTVANRLALMQKATDLFCIKHGLYDEQKQFGSLQLKSRYVRYFTSTRSALVQTRQMLVVYEPRAITPIVKELRKNHVLATKECKLMIYAYSDGAYAYNDEFEGLEEVVELVALPDALNQAIRNILPSPIEDTTIFEEGGEA